MAQKRTCVSAKTFLIKKRRAKSWGWYSSPTYPTFWHVENLYIYMFAIPTVVIDLFLFFYYNTQKIVQFSKEDVKMVAQKTDFFPSKDWPINSIICKKLFSHGRLYKCRNYVYSVFDRLRNIFQWPPCSALIIPKMLDSCNCCQKQKSYDHPFVKIHNGYMIKIARHMRITFNTRGLTSRSKKEKTFNHKVPRQLTISIMQQKTHLIQMQTTRVRVSLPKNDLDLTLTLTCDLDLNVWPWSYYWLVATYKGLTSWNK